MIVGADSSFRRLPAKLNRKQARFFDGIRVAIEMAELAHARLRESLERVIIRAFKEDKPQTDLIAPTFIDAWSLVDSIHRLRALLRYCPGLKGRDKSTVLRPFRDKIDSIEQLRHFIQHLNKKIGEISDETWPIWGTLNWYWMPAEGKAIQPGLCYRCTLVPGRIGAEKGVGWVQVATRVPAATIDQINLTAGGTSVCLDEIMNMLPGVARRLEEGLEKHSHHASLGSDLLICLEMVFSPDGTESHRPGRSWAFRQHAGSPEKPTAEPDSREG